MFIIWRKQEQFNSFNVTNGSEPNLILPKFARPFYFSFFFHQVFWLFHKKILLHKK